MSSIIRTTPETDEDVLYPSSDGAPVGETDWHMMALIWLRLALEEYFADRPDVKVASDMFLYYVEGDPSACKAPDVMVIKGVTKRWRRIFQTWVEKMLPCTIIEIASARTWEEDVGEKCRLYAKLGVAEYFVFDPEATYLDPTLQGFGLKGKKYVPLVPAADGSLLSKKLGLCLRSETPMLRLKDVRTGNLILTPQERIEQAQRQTEQAQRQTEQEKQRAKQEKQRADALEVELARLRAELPQRKGKKKER